MGCNTSRLLSRFKPLKQMTDDSTVLASHRKQSRACHLIRVSDLPPPYARYKQHEYFILVAAITGQYSCIPMHQLVVKANADLLR